MKEKPKSGGLKKLKINYEKKPLYGQYQARTNNFDVATKTHHQIVTVDWKLKLKDLFLLPKIKLSQQAVIKLTY